MSILRKQGFTYFLLGTIILMLTSPSLAIAVSDSDNSPISSLSKIDSELAGVIHSLSGNEVLPITLEFEKGASSILIEEILSKSHIEGIELRNIFRYIPFASMYASHDAILKLAEIPQVVAIHYDTRIEAPSFDSTSNIPQISQDAGYVHPTEILGTNNLWNEGYNGTGITIAVIDSGVDNSHPDLQDNIIGFQDFVNDQSDLDASNGITAYDDNGHGTAVTWLIVGSGEGTGYSYTGLAVGAEVLAIKTLDNEGTGDDSTIAEGIEFAISQGVDVISLSIGGEWLDSPLYSDASANAARAAVAAGIVVVVAAGNSGPATGTITSPGIVQEAITVGASIGGVDVVSFSSRGPVVRETSEPIGSVAKPDVLAPGYNVLSGISSDASPFEYFPYNSSQFDADYTLFSGTSAAAPQVAALAALLLDKHPAASPLEVKVALMKGATDLNADPLEQGFGLANVTRASELISDTSGVMTLISPMRYPTLPGSNQVLIIGDTRPPINATVISTVNQGYATIELSGNASQFIQTDESVTIGVGYSYFSIGLDVPPDLPLSALGQYSGQLNLRAGGDVVASLELDLLITTYGGRLLVDMGHHSADDQDDVSFYRYFSEYLREQGMVISEYPENWDDEFATPRAFDAASLSSTEVLMIMDTEESYSQNEIERIHSFVESGGTLLILSEGFNADLNVPAFAFESYNEILEPYGIQCEQYWIGDGAGEVYGNRTGGVVEDDPITEGVSNLYVLNGGTLAVDESVTGTKGLLWIDPAKTHAIVAVAEAGDGKVIAISDGSILYDSSIYDAELNDADNLKLLENVAKAIHPNLPRIYDVSLNYGEIGEDANLTAYVFDENIESVDITLIGPEGNEIDVPVEESLGYKYSMNFVLESTGFYEITVTAVNTQGFVRTYTETVLVPVEAIDDQILMTVIIGLISIIGLALGYVAILRFTRGRKLRQGLEREWSPRWESDDAPPAIE